VSSKAKFQTIRGTRDLLPPETALWTRVEQAAHEVFRTFGFGEVRPPIFEPTELFARAVGFETDIIGKEMFVLAQQYENQTSIDLARIRDTITFMAVSSGEQQAIDFFTEKIETFSKDYEAALKKGLVYQYEHANIGLDYLNDSLSHFHEILKEPRDADWQERFDSIVALCRQYLDAILLEPSSALRPEATASVCRAYIEHNMQQLPQPVKLYYMGPMFRRERPQKGRYRQFYQIGAEVLEAVRPDAGRDAAKELAKDATVDAEVIEMLMTFFDRLQLEGAELSINSIGHAADNCRRGYVEKLRGELNKVKDKLGADSQRRIDTNPLRVLDSKLEHEQAIIAALPKIADHLCDECKTHYAELKRQLELRGVKYVENWRLVRGLDYYMRTTFEITAKGLGSQNAVCGGGRYDGLVELLGGPPAKGIGFAIGEDRLILSLQEAGKGSVAEGRDIYIAWLGENAYATAIRAAQNLRKAGITVELPPTEQKFGKALERASKLGARFALILGDNEISSGEWALKALGTGEQIKIAEANLLAYLRDDQ
jgi:histidyl-tRNA synthetase